MSQAQHETFREELAIKYPAFGYALWDPGSRGRYHAVQVGDVGFIREGYFHRLFNVLHPDSAGGAAGDDPSDPSCRGPGSDDSELLQIKMDNHIGRSTEGLKEFLSKSIRVESRGHRFDASRPEDDAQVTFSCSRKQGALLSLPFPAQREDTAALRDFGKFIVKNIDSWFAYAEDLGLGIERMEDIILVTGCHRARSWVIATFSESQAGAQVSFGAEVVGDSRVDLEWRDARGGDLKLGPSGRNLPEDQCLFIRGFRVVRFLKFWPRLRGRATRSPDIGGHGPGPGTDLRLPLTTIAEDIGVNEPSSSYHFPNVVSVLQHQDPLYVLLRYIAERAPDCDMALVHDDDLAFIDGAMLETLGPDGLIGYLRSATPEIQQVQYDRGESGTVREVKVATLSHNALQAATATKNQSISDPNLSTPLNQPHDKVQHGVTVTVDSNPEKALNRLGHLGIQWDSPSHTRRDVTMAPVTTTSASSNSVLVDGYIAHCFTQQAEQCFFHFLKSDIATARVDSVPSAPGSEGTFFFVSSVPKHISSQFPGQSRWVLDRGVVDRGAVVPQTLWAPHTIADRRHHFEEAKLQFPIFFQCLDGQLGLTLEAAASGRCHGLVGAEDFAPLGHKSTTHIRIMWPGYGEFKRQVQIRDETSQRNPISNFRFAHHVGRSVDAFIRSRQPDSGHPDPRWRIGEGGIQPSEIVIIGAVHVSAGSWMPILQLNRYIS